MISSHSWNLFCISSRCSGAEKR